MRFAYLLFALTVILQPIGQILERKGMAQVGAITSIQQLLCTKTIWSIITNPYVLGGIGCSVIGLFLWLAALSNFKVSYLYPLGAISYIVLALLAWRFLGEGVTAIRWAGIFLIVAGAFLLNINTQ